MRRAFSYIGVAGLIFTFGACSNTNPLDPKALDAPPNFGKIPPMTKADREAQAAKEAKNKKKGPEKSGAAAK